MKIQYLLGILFLFLPACSESDLNSKAAAARLKAEGLIKEYQNEEIGDGDAEKLTFNSGEEIREDDGSLSLYSLDFPITVQKAAEFPLAFGHPSFRLEQPIPKAYEFRVPTVPYVSLAYKPRESHLLDVLLVLDTSGSMQAHINKVKNTLRTLTSSLGASDWRIKIIPSNNLVIGGQVFSPCVSPSTLKTVFDRNLDPNAADQFAASLDIIGRNLRSNASNIKERLIYQASFGLTCDYAGRETFVRPNSTIAVIFLTNSNNCSQHESCAVSPETFLPESVRNQLTKDPRVAAGFAEVITLPLPKEDGTRRSLGTSARVYTIAPIDPYKPGLQSSANGGLDHGGMGCVENYMTKIRSTSMGGGYVRLLNVFYGLGLNDLTMDSIYPSVNAAGTDYNPIQPAKKQRLINLYSKIDAYAVNICLLQNSYESFFTQIATGIEATYETSVPLHLLAMSSLPKPSVNADVYWTLPNSSVRHPMAMTEESFRFLPGDQPTGDVEIYYQIDLLSKTLNMGNLLEPNNENAVGLLKPQNIVKKRLMINPGDPNEREITSYQVNPGTEPGTFDLILDNIPNAGDLIRFEYEYEYVTEKALGDDVVGLPSTINISGSQGAMTLEINKDYTFIPETHSIKILSPAFSVPGVVVTGSLFIDQQTLPFDQNGNSYFTLPQEAVDIIGIKAIGDTACSIDDVSLAVESRQATINCPGARGIATYYIPANQMIDIGLTLNDMQISLLNQRVADIKCSIGKIDFDSADWFLEGTTLTIPRETIKKFKLVGEEEGVCSIGLGKQPE